MKLSLSTIKSINFKEVVLSVGRLWMRIYRYVFLITFIVVLLWGVFVGYRTLVAFEWAQDRKDEYIAQERKKFEFQEEHFSAIVAAIEKRQELYSQVPQNIRDPFYEIANSAVEEPASENKEEQATPQEPDSTPLPTQ